MISHNPYSNCMNARLYYYDFLSERTRRVIPESALAHITQCLDCKVEIDRLEMMLLHVDRGVESEQRRKDSAISTLLKLHFAFIGEPVKCSTVRPFLASMADPVLKIRVPTPISMHIDKCRACSRDLLTLRGLHLTHKQLCRLGQLLAEEPTGGTASCSQARAAIPTVVSMVFRETNAETLKHLCTCPNCRKQLHKRREAARRELLRDGAAQGEFPCEAVRASDIYDYALPYGIDPANDQYAEFREPLAAHLRSCPACLGKVQELHRTVSGIAERPETEVVTVYHLDEPVEAQLVTAERPAAAGPLSGSGELGAGSAIRVKTAGREDIAAAGQPAATIDFAARLKRRVRALNVKPLLKAGAVAAVMLLGLALLLSAPTAKAVTLDQVYRAVEKVRNVYIATFSPDKTEPIREAWVSRSLNIYMSKVGNVLILSDAANKLEKRRAGGGSVVEKPLSDEFCAEIEKTYAGYLDLLPFARISDVPKDANWNRVASDALRIAAENAEVYDLTWTEETYRGSPVFWKSRYFVDPETGLPNKVEHYRKSSIEGEYTLQSKMIVQRSNDSEILAAVEDAFPGSVSLR
jgi:hypothetical protein